MQEEARKYSGAYFAGDWTDHAAHITATRKALAILRDAVTRTADEDVRGCPDIDRALHHFTHCTAALRFRQGLDVPDRQQRFYALRAAYNGMLQNAAIIPDVASLDRK